MRGNERFADLPCEIGVGGEVIEFERITDEDWSDAPQRNGGRRRGHVDRNLRHARSFASLGCHCGRSQPPVQRDRWVSGLPPNSQAKGGEYLWEKACANPC